MNPRMNDTGIRPRLRPRKLDHVPLFRHPYDMYESSSNISPSEGKFDQKFDHSDTTESKFRPSSSEYDSQNFKEIIRERNNLICHTFFTENPFFDAYYSIAMRKNRNSSQGTYKIESEVSDTEEARTYNITPSEKSSLFEGDGSLVSSRRKKTDDVHHFHEHHHFFHNVGDMNFPEGSLREASRIKDKLNHRRVITDSRMIYQVQNDLSHPLDIASKHKEVRRSGTSLDRHNQKDMGIPNDKTSRRTSFSGRDSRRHSRSSEPNRTSEKTIIVGHQYETKREMMPIDKNRKVEKKEKKKEKKQDKDNKKAKIESECTGSSKFHKFKREFKDIRNVVIVKCDHCRTLKESENDKITEGDFSQSSFDITDHRVVEKGVSKDGYIVCSTTTMGGSLGCSLKHSKSEKSSSRETYEKKISDEGKSREDLPCIEDRRKCIRHGKQQVKSGKGAECNIKDEMNSAKKVGKCLSRRDERSQLHSKDKSTSKWKKSALTNSEKNSNCNKRNEMNDNCDRTKWVNNIENSWEKVVADNYKTEATCGPMKMCNDWADDAKKRIICPCMINISQQDIIDDRKRPVTKHPTKTVLIKLRCEGATEASVADDSATRKPNANERYETGQSKTCGSNLSPCHYNGQRSTGDCGSKRALEDVRIMKQSCDEHPRSSEISTIVKQESLTAYAPSDILKSSVDKGLNGIKDELVDIKSHLRRLEEIHSSQPRGSTVMGDQDGSELSNHPIVVCTSTAYILANWENKKNKKEQQTEDSHQTHVQSNLGNQNESLQSSLIETSRQCSRIVKEIRKANEQLMERKGTDHCNEHKIGRNHSRDELNKCKHERDAKENPKNTNQEIPRVKYEVFVKSTNAKPLRTYHQVFNCRRGGEKISNVPSRSSCVSNEGGNLDRGLHCRKQIIRSGAQMQAGVTSGDSFDGRFIDSVVGDEKARKRESELRVMEWNYMQSLDQVNFKKEEGRRKKLSPPGILGKTTDRREPIRTSISGIHQFRDGSVIHLLGKSGWTVSTKKVNLINAPNMCTSSSSIRSTLVNTENLECKSCNCGACRCSARRGESTTNITARKRPLNKGLNHILIDMVPSEENDIEAGKMLRQKNVGCLNLYEKSRWNNEHDESYDVLFNTKTGNERRNDIFNRSGVIYPFKRQCGISYEGALDLPISGRVPESLGSNYFPGSVYTREDSLGNMDLLHLLSVRSSTSVPGDGHQCSIRRRIPVRIPILFEEVMPPREAVTFVRRPSDVSLKQVFIEERGTCGRPTGVTWSLKKRGSKIKTKCIFGVSRWRALIQNNEKYSMIDHHKRNNWQVFLAQQENGENYNYEQKGDSIQTKCTCCNCSNSHACSARTEHEELTGVRRLLKDLGLTTLHFDFVKRRLDFSTGSMKRCKKENLENKEKNYNNTEEDHQQSETQGVAGSKPKKKHFMDYLTGGCNGRESTKQTGSRLRSFSLALNKINGSKKARHSEQSTTEGNDTESKEYKSKKRHLSEYLRGRSTSKSNAENSRQLRQLSNSTNVRGKSRGENSAGTLMYEAEGNSKSQLAKGIPSEMRERGDQDKGSAKEKFRHSSFAGTESYTRAPIPEESDNEPAKEESMNVELNDEPTTDEPVENEVGKKSQNKIRAENREGNCTCKASNKSCSHNTQQYAVDGMRTNSSRKSRNEEGSGDEPMDDGRKKKYRSQTRRKKCKCKETANESMWQSNKADRQILAENSEEADVKRVEEGSNRRIATETGKIYGDGIESMIESGRQTRQPSKSSSFKKASNAEEGNYIPVENEQMVGASKKSLPQRRKGNCKCKQPGGGCGRRMKTSATNRVPIQMAILEESEYEPVEDEPRVNESKKMKCISKRRKNSKSKQFEDDSLSANQKGRRSNNGQAPNLEDFEGKPMGGEPKRKCPECCKRNRDVKEPQNDTSGTEGEQGREYNEDIKLSNQNGTAGAKRSYHKKQMSPSEYKEGVLTTNSNKSSSIKRNSQGSMGDRGSAQLRSQNHNSDTYQIATENITRSDLSMHRRRIAECEKLLKQFQKKLEDAVRNTEEYVCKCKQNFPISMEDNQIILDKVEEEVDGQDGYIRFEGRLVTARSEKKSEAKSSRTSVSSPLKESSSTLSSPASSFHKNSAVQTMPQSKRDDQLDGKESGNSGPGSNGSFTKNDGVLGARRSNASESAAEGTPCNCVQCARSNTDHSDRSMEIAAQTYETENDDVISVCTGSPNRSQGFKSSECVSLSSNKDVSKTQSTEECTPAEESEDHEPEQETSRSKHSTDDIDKRIDSETTMLPNATDSERNSSGIYCECDFSRDSNSDSKKMVCDCGPRLRLMEERIHALELRKPRSSSNTLSLEDIRSETDVEVTKVITCQNMNFFEGGDLASACKCAEDNPCAFRPYKRLASDCRNKDVFFVTNIKTFRQWSRMPNFYKNSHCKIRSSLKLKGYLEKPREWKKAKTAVASFFQSDRLPNSKYNKLKGKFSRRVHSSKALPRPDGLSDESFVNDCSRSSKPLMKRSYQILGGGGRPITKSSKKKGHGEKRQGKGRKR